VAKPLLLRALPILVLLLGFALAAPAANATATLSASPASVAPGGTLTATWSGIATPTSTDWIGLFVPGAANTAYLKFQYTNGAASGSAAFVIPAGTAVGTYQLRLFANNGYTLLATSSNFAVAVTPTTLSASPASVATGGTLTATWSGIAAPTSADWIGLFTPGAADTVYLGSRNTTGAASGSVPFALPAGVPPGTYELRLFANGGFTRLAMSSSFTVIAAPTLNVSPATLAAGATLSATWGGIAAPTSTDWLALATPDSPDTVYLSSLTTTGAASGSLPFVIPAGTAPGAYELRLFANGGYTRLATSNGFTVATPTATANFYIQTDQLNTPRTVTDSSNAIVWRWDNDDAFGGNVPNSNPSGLGTFTFNLRFPDQYFDSETNNHYNYFRDYNPEIGRYVESDPIGLRGGINTYAYVDTSPIGYIDPLGLQAAAGAGSVGGFGGLGGFGQCCSNSNKASGNQNGLFGDDSRPRSRKLLPNWMHSESEESDPWGPTIGSAQVPAYPGLTSLTDCTPGKRLIEPAVGKKYRGGVSIEQEYFCPCGQITRHTIIVRSVVVHDHFRPGPPKGGGGD
jgi:RHS repeat-associated protein